MHLSMGGMPQTRDMSPEWEIKLESPELREVENKYELAEIVKTKEDLNIINASRSRNIEEKKSRERINQFIFCKEIWN